MKNRTGSAGKAIVIWRQVRLWVALASLLLAGGCAIAPPLDTVGIDEADIPAAQRTQGIVQQGNAYYHYILKIISSYHLGGLYSWPTNPSASRQLRANSNV